MGMSKYNTKPAMEKIYSVAEKARLPITTWLRMSVQIWVAADRGCDLMTI